MKKLADKLILTEILKERNLSMECENLNFKDFAKFSLTNYQQSAVKNALKILKFYYSREQENLLRKYREFDKKKNTP